MADRPPLQLTIDLCCTITPNKFHIEKNAHISMADGSPTPLILPIDLCLYNYIYKVSYIEECTYTHGRWMADGRSGLHHYTK